MAKPKPNRNAAAKRRPNTNFIKSVSTASEDVSARSPQTVRDAFLRSGKPEIVEGLKLMPLDWGMFLTLEDINSPLLSGSTVITFSDIANAVFIFAHPEKAEGLKAAEINKLARDLLRTVSVSTLEPFSKAITKQIEGALKPAIRAEGQDSSDPSTAQPPK